MLSKSRFSTSVVVVLTSLVLAAGLSAVGCGSVELGYNDDSASSRIEAGEGDGGTTGQGCGGWAGLFCAKGFYCFSPESTPCTPDDVGGTCQPLPTTCNTNYDPVCGCDGKTYSNSCAASSDGINVWGHGACVDGRPPPIAGGPGSTCGGLAAVACATGYYCVYPESAPCGANDVSGTCEEIPTGVACAPLYAPVCGCDGTTYSSGCAAQLAGKNVSHTGECP